MSAQSQVEPQLVDQLVETIDLEQFTATDQTQSRLDFAELAGFSADELQQFLEDKVGTSEEEGVQGTIASAIATPGAHC